MAQGGGAVATGDLGWITERDEAYRDRFRQLLVRERTRGLATGWQLAVDLGRPAVKVLWRLFEAEPADVDHRLALLAAALLAGGAHEDQAMFDWLGANQKKVMLEERTLAALLVALGPNRTRPEPQFWSRFLGASKTPEDLLGIAVRLASARFPESREGAPALASDDPGLAAAAAFAGLPIPPAVQARFKDPRERHAELFWRGTLLAAARRREPPPQELLTTARELMRTSDDGLAAARGAAAWLRAVSGDLRTEAAPSDVALLRIVAADPATANVLQRALGPTAHPRDQAPQRLAVAYALALPVATVVEQRDAWAADERLRRHVAIALAWRLATEAPGAPIDAVLASVPEWAFVRGASGATFDPAVRCADARLQAALPLLASGRLERPALAALLEETLWRWGSHPNRVPWELERLLVRDLLLAGSNPGGSKYQPAVRPEQRYSPRGIDRSHSFFSIAVELFDFVGQAGGAIPAEALLTR